jgi:hypothetical protein
MLLSECVHLLDVGHAELFQLIKLFILLLVFVERLGKVFKSFVYSLIRILKA